MQRDNDKRKKRKVKEKGKKCLTRYLTTQPRERKTKGKQTNKQTRGIRIATVESEEEKQDGRQDDKAELQ